MDYKLAPLNGNISLVPLTPKEVKECTGKNLIDADTSKMNVLNYGRVVGANYMPTLEELSLVVSIGQEWTTRMPSFKEGDIVLYQKLAAHKTNFGSPRVEVVPITHIEAKLEAVK